MSDCKEDDAIAGKLIECKQCGKPVKHLFSSWIFPLMCQKCWDKAFPDILNDASSVIIEPELVGDKIVAASLRFKEITEGKQ